MEKETIGARLRTLRGKRTRSEVAKAVGVSPSSITMYELDQRIPRYDVMIKLAKYFGKSVGAIFFAK